MILTQDEELVDTNQLDQIKICKLLPPLRYPAYTAKKIDITVVYLHAKDSQYSKQLSLSQNIIMEEHLCLKTLKLYEKIEFSNEDK